MFRLLTTCLLAFFLATAGTGVGDSRAAAGEVIYSFAGVVGADGRDENGIFAAPGSSLAGHEFTAVYRWNPAVRPAALLRGTYAQFVLGGRNFVSPQAIEATLSINGQTFLFGTEVGVLQRLNGVGSPSSGTGLDLIGAEAFGNDPYLGIAILATFIRPVLGLEFIADADLTGAIAPTAAPASLPISSFTINRPGSQTADFTTGGGLSIASFSVATIGTIEVAGVPEPSAWALLVLGFGAVGAALRGSRAAPQRRSWSKR